MHGGNFPFIRNAFAILKLYSRWALCCSVYFASWWKIEDNDYFGHDARGNLFWICKTILFGLMAYSHIWLKVLMRTYAWRVIQDVLTVSGNFLKGKLWQDFEPVFTHQSVAWMSDGGTLIHLNFSSDMIFSNILYDQFRLGMHAIWLEEPRTNFLILGASQMFVRKLSWHKCFLRITIIFYLNAVDKKCYFWDKQQIEMSGGGSKKCSALGILLPSKCRASLLKKCKKAILKPDT